MAHETHVLDTLLAGRRGLDAGWLGPGDDACALPWSTPDELVVLTTDSLEEDVHFRADWQSLADLAHRLLAVNLSDLAAMGAAPVGYLLALSWPDRTSAEDARAFAAGLRAAEDRFDCPVLGGDTDVTSGRLHLGATLLGRTPSPVRRAGARPGDTVFVSGPLGGPAAVVRKLLEGRPPDGDDPAWADAGRRFRRPEPRLALGRALRGRASAMIDLSDGLRTDLTHLATASGVAARVELARLPIHPAARLLGDPDGLALDGGEDYELLVAGPSELAGLGLGLVAIGEVTSGRAGAIELSGTTNRTNG